MPEDIHKVIARLRAAIVTISIALGAHSAEKQGSHQTTLTFMMIDAMTLLATADEVIE